MTSVDPACAAPWFAVETPALERASGPRLGREPASVSAITPDATRGLLGLEAADQLLQEVISAQNYSVSPLDYSLPAGFRLSVVMPVYNERDTIIQILARVYSLPIPMEIILVDDGSTDGTRELLECFRAVPELKCLWKTRNEGKGAALRTGFERASGEIVIVQDADLEYDPRDIPGVIRPIVEGRADVVFGSRFKCQGARGSSRIHRWGNKLLTRASNWLTGLPLTDMETCYKAFRREALLAIPLRQNRFGFEPEITAKIARRRLRVTEVPVRYQAREWGQGKKICWQDAVNALYCITRYAVAD